MKETEFVNSFSDYGKTEPIGPFGGPTMPETDYQWNPERQTANGIPTRPSGNGSGFTVPTAEPFQPEAYGGTVPVTPADHQGFLPAVGWLVCVDGVDRGRDYRLHDGYNRIGRNPGNDICISGDVTVSGDGHALVAFDPKNSVFFAAPGTSINLVRLNDDVLMMPSPLNANDVLTVGTTKLMFVPLCSDSFSW